MYIPAFRKAATDLFKTARNDSGHIVIFLSDGEPWDQSGPEGIYKAVEYLIDRGICVYTIGYGQEVFSGSRSEDILQEIVRMSRLSADCGQYKYSPSDDLVLSKIFGRIYRESIGDLYNLELDAKLSSDVLYENETLSVNTKVLSSVNKNPLPGLINESELCGPPAMVSVSVTGSSGEIEKEAAMGYVGASTGYRAEFSGLSPGKKTIRIRAEAACTNEERCNYVGNATMTAHVLETSTFSVNPGFLILIGGIIAAFAATTMFSSKNI